MLKPGGASALVGFCLLAAIAQWPVLERRPLADMYELAVAAKCEVRSSRAMGAARPASRHVHVLRVSGIYQSGIGPRTHICTQGHI